MFGTESFRYNPRQLYQVGGTPGAECRLLPASAQLGTAVHYHWSLSIEAGTVELPVIPDNAVDLVLCPNLHDFAALYFPVENPYTITLEGPVHYVGTCLRLEGLTSLLGHSPDVLRDLEAGPATVSALSLGALIAKLSVLEDPHEIGRSLDAFFLAHRRPPKPVSESDAASEFDQALVEQFLDTLEPVHVAGLAQRIGVSERQLRRETRRLFGLAPKKIQRIVRLQRALGELIDDGPAIADFHDDSHRIRELRVLTGWTPSELSRLARKYHTDHPVPSSRLS